MKRSTQVWHEVIWPVGVVVTSLNVTFGFLSLWAGWILMGQRRRKHICFRKTNLPSSRSAWGWTPQSSCESEIPRRICKTNRWTSITSLTRGHRISNPTLKQTLQAPSAGVGNVEPDREHYVDKTQANPPRADKCVCAGSTWKACVAGTPAERSSGNCYEASLKRSNGEWGSCDGHLALSRSLSLTRFTSSRCLCIQPIYNLLSLEGVCLCVCGCVYLSWAQERRAD